MANPAVACTTSDQRAGAVANAKASQPVRKAAPSSASRATLVRAPRAMAVIYLLLLLLPSATWCSAARVAQGIEQDGPNVKVGGSIPSAGTILMSHDIEDSFPPMSQDIVDIDVGSIGW